MLFTSLIAGLVAPIVEKTFSIAITAIIFFVAGVVVEGITCWAVPALSPLSAAAPTITDKKQRNRNSMIFAGILLCGAVFLWIGNPPLSDFELGEKLTTFIVPIIAAVAGFHYGFQTRTPAQEEE